MLFSYGAIVTVDNWQLKTSLNVRIVSQTALNAPLMVCAIHIFGLVLASTCTPSWACLLPRAEILCGLARFMRRSKGP
jgi:hypothetical protein